MAAEISLRDVRTADLAVFFEQQREPEAIEMAAFPPRAYDEFMAHWARCLAEETAILKTIVFRGQVAGNIVCWKQAGTRNIGYWLGKAYWGQGIATAALAQFLEHVQSRPLYAHVAKENAASIRVLQKCGFTLSGEETYRGLTGEPSRELIMKLDASITRSVSEGIRPRCE